jgi:hypothetical protein
MRLTRKPSLLMLGLYLVLAGTVQLVAIPLPPVLLGLVALFAGVLILLDR